MNVEQLTTRIIAKETIEQIECGGVKPDLVKLAKKAIANGYIGFAVMPNWKQFIACFINNRGEPVEMTFASHATPEAALVALGG